MRIIGITGPSGAGKSVISALLDKYSIPTIDADAVYHSLLIPPSPCLDALKNAFGDRIFNSDGSLDRTALGAIVFSDEQKLSLLNSTVLSFVLDRIRLMISELSAQGHAAVAVDAPTLIESGFDRECDEVISVLASSNVRLERIMARDSISKEKAMLRINAQKDDSFYILHSDSVLYNDGCMEQIANELHKLLLDKGFISGEQK